MIKDRLNGLSDEAKVLLMLCGISVILLLLGIFLDWKNCFIGFFQGFYENLVADLIIGLVLGFVITNYLGLIDRRREQEELEEQITIKLRDELLNLYQEAARAEISMEAYMKIGLPFIEFNIWDSLVDQGVGDVLKDDRATLFNLGKLKHHSETLEYLSKIYFEAFNEKYKDLEIYDQSGKIRVKEDCKEDDGSHLLLTLRAPLMEGFASIQTYIQNIFRDNEIIRCGMALEDIKEDMSIRIDIVEKMLGIKE